VQHAQTTRLQAALESAESLAASTSAALEKARSTNESNEARLTEAHTRIAELTTRTAEQELAFRTEIDAQKRLVELLERRDEESAARLAEVEREWTASQTLAETKAIEWDNAIEAERSRADALAQEVEVARSQAEQSMRQSGDQSDFFAPPSRAGTPGLPGSPAGPAFALSPSASMAARLQKGGRSYTEVYSEYVRVQDELVAERAEVKRLGDILTSILADIEERVRAGPSIATA
jgi:nucleoprotein TPR